MQEELGLFWANSERETAGGASANYRLADEEVTKSGPFIKRPAPPGALFSGQMEPFLRQSKLVLGLPAAIVSRQPSLAPGRPLFLRRPAAGRPR